ncbi:hypothetical protein OPV22_024062 [Ensete ventricosum]|uniref:Uncharacterized protein n=1 Tax=Ensete ventricosum TaxID=4639 RepID=A0AAV8PDK2_ENSVE|nr:hypothetical protein OPV22_024062 [Ensete ventricosum]
MMERAFAHPLQQQQQQRDRVLKHLLPCSVPSGDKVCTITATRPRCRCLKTADDGVNNCLGSDTKIQGNEKTFLHPPRPFAPSFIDACLVFDHNVEANGIRWVSLDPSRADILIPRRVPRWDRLLIHGLIATEQNQFELWPPL